MLSLPWPRPWGALPLSPGNTCEGAEGVTAFVLVTLRDSLFSTVKSWVQNSEINEGKTFFFSCLWEFCRVTW